MLTHYYKSELTPGRFFTMDAPETGCLLANSPYGMPQLQHCSFGQMTWTLSTTIERVYTTFFYSDILIIIIIIIKCTVTTWQ